MTIVGMRSQKHSIRKRSKSELILAAIVSGLIAPLLVGCAGNGEPTEAIIVTTTSTTGGDASTAPGTVDPESTNSETTDAGTTDPGTSDSGTTGAGTADRRTADSGVATTERTEPGTIDLAASTMSTRPVGSFAEPIGLAVRPNDARLFIIEQAGRVVAIEPTGDNQRTVLDMSSLTASGGERGLLGLAFHPIEALAYIDYTDLDGNTVVAEYRVGSDGTFDPASQRIVWQLDQPYGNHNGGDLNFGPDKMLYIAVGDGGSGGDPERRASDPSTAFGSLVRLDPTGRADGAYSIPDDNPFGNEVWAYGLRNPWKFNFDPRSGDLWIADVGQNKFEEVDHVASIDGAPAGRGANFGWSAYEATTRFNDDVAEPETMVLPVMYYEHSGGNCSISGSAMLSSWYLYGDYCTGKLWAFTPAAEGAEARNVDVGGGFGQLAAVRNGPNGSVYAVQRGGSVTELLFD